MLNFALAAIFLLITPGPGVLTTAGVAAAYGFRSGLAYMWGIVLGGQAVLLAVATGLAAIVFAVPFVREVLLAASATYLLYLAARIALSGKDIGFIEGKSPRFIDGFLLQIINPKGYAVGTAVFSGFPLFPDDLVLENAVKVAVMFAVAVPVHLAWLYAGAALKRLALGAGLTRAINYAMALALTAVVILAVIAQLQLSPMPV